jgi:hypothetical protein
MESSVKELIELCIYCWGHPLLYTFSGSVAVWMLLSGNLQQVPGIENWTFLPRVFSLLTCILASSIAVYFFCNHGKVLSNHNRGYSLGTGRVYILLVGKCSRTRHHNVDRLFGVVT